MRHDARVSDAAPGRHVGGREDDDPADRGEDDGGEQYSGEHYSGEHALDPGEPTAPTFSPKPVLRTGYDRAAVDAFVTKVVLAVHDERQTSVSADEVARTRFPGRRLGPGYRMREVDDYLGAAEALLRMRATARGVSPAPAPSGGAGEHEVRHRSRATSWIYGVAALIIVLVVIFTVTQT